MFVAGSMLLWLTRSTRYNIQRRKGGSHGRKQTVGQTWRLNAPRPLRPLRLEIPETLSEATKFASIWTPLSSPALDVSQAISSC